MQAEKKPEPQVEEEKKTDHQTEEKEKDEVPDILNINLADGVPTEDIESLCMNCE
jgi:hypothetical protein